MSALRRGRDSTLPDSFEIVVGVRSLAAVRTDWRGRLEAAGALDPEGPFFARQAGETPYVGRSDHRARTLPGGAGERVFIREYRHGGFVGRWLGGAFLGSRRPFREIAVVEAARRGGVLTPEILACVGRKGILFTRWRLVQAELADCIDLLEYFRGVQARPSGAGLGRKREILVGMGRAVRGLHDLGIYHGDLHLKNMMVRRGGGPEMILVDFDKSRRHATLPDRLRLRNLLRLDRSVEKWKLREGFAIHATDRWRFLRAYGGGQLPPRPEIERWLRLRRRSLAFHRALWRAAGRRPGPAEATRQLRRAGGDWLLDRDFAPALESGIVDRVEEIAGGRVGTKVKENNVRTVIRLGIEGDRALDLFLKIYRRPTGLGRLRRIFFGTRAANEWRVLRACRARRLPAPRAVLLGEGHPGWGPCADLFATLAIPEATLVTETAERLLAGGQAGRRGWRRLLRDVARTVRGLHDRGVDHRDLHLDNVLVEGTPPPGSPFALHLLDFHSARLRRMRRSRRRRALAKLAFSLPRGASRTDRLRLLLAYAGEAGCDGGVIRTEWRQLERRIVRLERRRIRSRSRRCVVNSSRFRIERLDGFRLFRRTEIAASFFREALGEHARCIEAGGDRMWKAGRTNRISRFEAVLGGRREPLCVKEYRERKFLDRLKFLLGRRRGLAAWRAAHGLDVRGFRTAEALGFLLPRRGGSQYLVMRNMVAWERLDHHVLRRWPTVPRGAELEAKRGFIRATARLFARLHGAGVYHGDTKATNVLVLEGGELGWEFLLVDTDRVVFRSRVGRRRRIKNLAQLHASVPICVTRADRLRFFREYVGEGPLGEEDKRTVRRIEGECRRKRRVGATPIE